MLEGGAGLELRVWRKEGERREKEEQVQEINRFFFYLDQSLSVFPHETLDNCAHGKA